MLDYICDTAAALTTWPRRLCTGARLVLQTTKHLHHADGISRAPTGDIDVQIGRPPNARIIRISQAALMAVRILRRELCDGAKILNADPDVFEIVLQYIGQNKFLAHMPLGVRNPLEQLALGDDPMLSLAKTYHLSKMLNHIRLQNTLIDVFSINYRHLLLGRTRIRPSSDAFNYLRLYVGTYTRCEKFMVEFYAGLAARTGGLQATDLEHLPLDIAKLMQLRCTNILQGYGDRVLQGHKCFKLSASHKSRCWSTLHVVQPSAVTATAAVTRTQTEWQQYLSRRTQIPRPTVSQSTQSTRAPVPIAPTNERVYRSHLCVRTNIRRDFVIGSPSVTVHVEAAAPQTQSRLTVVITTQLPFVVPDPVQ